MWRAAFIVPGLFTAIGIAYIAARLVLEIGWGNSWAGPVSGAVFAIAMVAIDRWAKMRFDQPVTQNRSMVRKLKSLESRGTDG
jgi:hypothetical protein